MEKITNKLLDQRVILITGASRGIGRAVAKAAAFAGATVILLARNVPQLETVYDEIESSGGPKPAIYPFNLLNARPEDYQDLRNNIEKHFGRLDGLLHNAGLLGGLTPIEHLPFEQWQQVLQVNLNAAFLLTQATLPLLKKGHHASLLFTTSEQGIKPKAYWGPYAVSKAGIYALMQILHDELEINTDIRVNCVNPGKVRTSLRMSAYPGENPSLLPTPESIAAHYIELLSPNNTVRGQRIILPSVEF